MYSSSLAIQPMSQLKDFEMPDFSSVSQQLAVALLDAWCSHDPERIHEVAGNFHAYDSQLSDPGEAERLELLGCIANELYRAAKFGAVKHEKSDRLEPFIGLLLHLAEPAEVRDLSYVD